MPVVLGVPDVVDVHGVSGMGGAPDVSDVLDAPCVPGHPGEPGGTIVDDGWADGENRETDVDVGVDGGAVDVDMMVVGAGGCGGVDDGWAQEPRVVGVGLVSSVLILQMALTTEEVSFNGRYA